MARQEIRPEFTKLLSRHSELVILFGDRLRRDPADEQIDIGERFGQLWLEERNLRARIITWIPINASEARKKMEHLTRFVATTGVSLDQAALDLVLHSIELFFQD